MPRLRCALRAPLRVERVAGVTWVYPLSQLRREVAYIAYHFHWGHEEAMALPHAERALWVGQISAMNKAILDA